ncbi:MerR family transcriptional regulator [Chlamydiota bacterium]
MIEKKKTLLRRGSLAKELHLPWPTVKYYQEQGLFPIAKRTPHGHNLYDINKIKEVFQSIKALKQQRLTIDEIKNRLIIKNL